MALCYPYCGEKNMGKSQPKRRTTSAPSHQAAKTSSKKTKKIDWTRIALIVIGLMIVISMVLSMIKLN